MDGWNDMVNGSYEFVGGFMCWLNYFKIRKDKCVRGVHWGVSMFFATWGIWNIIYYPSLGQWVSTAGAVFLAAGNWAWVILAIKYRNN